ncbi:MAG: aspartate kinase [Spirochaetia bacterium]|nr:aspartate kinase [Spirochaetia bacterium]
MNMIVSKFGGSSLCDATHIKKVAQILKSDSSRVVAVVSAPGKRNKEDTKITDALYRCEKLVATGVSCKDEFEVIRERYLTIAKDLGVKGNIASALDEVYDNISKGAGKDYAASRGEYLNAVIISQYLGWNLIDASDVVLIEQDGTVNEQTYVDLKKAINPKEHYIFPGFYGRDTNGKVKTFSRGGSDISGAIVARSLGECLYENWTDVSGISKADPRIISDAKVIDKLTYNEVRELASVGFNVFHEEAIAPVREAGIPIQVKNTNKPEDKGTSIVASRDPLVVPIVGLTAKKGYFKIAIHKLFILKKPQVKVEIEAKLIEAGFSLEFILRGIDDLTYYAQGEDVAEETITQLINNLTQTHLLEEMEITSGFAIAAVTGVGLGHEKKKISLVASSLLEKGLDVEFVQLGASPITALFGIKEEQTNSVIHTLYDLLFR